MIGAEDSGSANMRALKALRLVRLSKMLRLVRRTAIPRLVPLESTDRFSELMPACLPLLLLTALA